MGVSRVSTQGRAQRGDEGTESWGGGGPDLRRGDFVCLHLGSLSLLITSPHTLSLEKVGVTGGRLAVHLVRGGSYRWRGGRERLASATYVIIETSENASASAGP